MFIQQKKLLIEKIKTLKIYAEDIKDESIISKIKIFEKEITDDLTFNVLCLGDFSSGKSTFINNFFIGKTPLPTNVTTTTAKLTIIKYGETEEIVLKYKDGSKKSFKENFENILKESVAKNGRDIDNIDFVEVYINSKFLKEGVVIVDSPGLNDPETERMQVTYDYIEKADSVLYLLTAMQAWKKSEKEFLEEKILRKEDLDKVFFLLNYWDIIDQNQQDDLLQYIKTEINKSLKIASLEMGRELSIPPMIPISAKTKENFDVLKEQLWQYLGSKKGADILKTKKSKFLVLRNKIVNLLEEKIFLQEQETSQLDETLKSLENEIAKYKNKVDEFKKLIESEVEAIVKNWTEEISEFQKLLGNKINMKISQKLGSVKTPADFDKLIKDSIQKTIHIEKNDFDYKNKIFIKEINNFVKEKKAALNLEKYFVKNEIINLDKQTKDMKENISPELINDYQTDVFIAGGSVTVAGILALTIASPFALIGLFGFGYGEFIVKPKRFQKDLQRKLPDVEEQIETIINENIQKIQRREDNIINSILNQINNDIIDAYKEKERIYQEALKNKTNQQSDEINKYYKDKILELNRL